MNLFTKHPRSIGESYTEHLFFAFCTGIKLIFGGIACIIHAIFPFLFERTGSTMAKKMLDDVARRQQQKL
jgi:hypothetical protein